MMTAPTETQSHKTFAHHQGIPFESAEEAWFWFIQAQQARNEGTRSGTASVARPCEPIDIFKVMERLYRQRHLKMDHVLVLRHYGQRLMAPDARRMKEARAYILWVQALDRMAGPLIRKGIVESDHAHSFESWLLSDSVSNQSQETPS